MFKIYLKNFQLSKAGDWYYHPREYKPEVKTDDNGTYIEVSDTELTPIFFAVDSDMGKLIAKAIKGK